MKSALFAGSFDPPTLGHMNIIERSGALFDRLVVAIAINNTKQPLLSIEDRLSLLKELSKQWPNVEVVSYSGLTVRFAKEQNLQCLIRSIRASEDCAIEQDLARSNFHLAKIETLLLPADEKYSFIRSTIVREIAANQGDLTAFVPKLVAAKLTKN